MIDPGGPMIHDMADIAITHSLVERCDFGALDFITHFLRITFLDIGRAPRSHNVSLADDYNNNNNNNNNRRNGSF